jgi:hypothetical protein
MIQTSFSSALIFFIRAHLFHPRSSFSSALIRDDPR